MQFYNPEYFLSFWLLPLLIFLFVLAIRRKLNRKRLFGNLKTIDRISNFSERDWKLRAVAVCLAIVFALFALLRPQWGEEKKKLKRKGVDVIFLLDTSLSMLAADAKPNRIEKAKMEIKSFVKQLKGDRVGLIPFAGSSFLQCPLTLDYAAFFLFLDSVNVGYIPDPGSSLADALNNAIQSFPKDEKKFRVAIVFSDGEFHGEDVEPSLKKALEEGVHIYAAGVGTKEGEPIPLRAGKNKVVGYKKDSSGQVVISKLNAELLSKLANESGGMYFPATPAEREVDLIYQDMQKLGKKEFKEKLLTEKEDHYQGFLFIGLLFLFYLLFTEGRLKKTNSMEILG